MTSLFRTQTSWGHADDVSDTESYSQNQSSSPEVNTQQCFKLQFFGINIRMKSLLASRSALGGMRARACCSTSTPKCRNEKKGVFAKLQDPRLAVDTIRSQKGALSRFFSIIGRFTSSRCLIVDQSEPFLQSIVTLFASECKYLGGGLEGISNLVKEGVAAARVCATLSKGVLKNNHAVLAEANL